MTTNATPAGYAIPDAEHLDQFLDMLHRAETAEQQRRNERDIEQLESVRALRRGGASWQQIADALGVTRSAAHQRFATATH